MFRRIIRSGKYNEERYADGFTKRNYISYVSKGYGGNGKASFRRRMWSNTWKRTILRIGPMPISLHNFEENSLVNEQWCFLQVKRTCPSISDPNEWADLFAASGAK